MIIAGKVLLRPTKKIFRKALQHCPLPTPPPRPTLAPRLRNAPRYISNSGRTATDKKRLLYLRPPAAWHKISAMSGVDQYKTREGNTSGLYCLGFLNSRRLALHGVPNRDSNNVQHRASKSDLNTPPPPHHLHPPQPPTTHASAGIPGLVLCPGFRAVDGLAGG